MSTKMKGICKSFKFISQIFVVTKEREMEIGYPTDVKHVAHIGWDSHNSNAPSWMNEFKTTSDFSANSLSIGDAKDLNRVTGTTWGSQDFEQSLSMGHIQPASDIFMRESRDSRPTDLPKAQKKHKRKNSKNKSTTSSPKSSSTSPSIRSSSRNAAKSKSLLATSDLTTPNVQGLL